MIIHKTPSRSKNMRVYKIVLILQLICTPMQPKQKKKAKNCFEKASEFTPF